MAGPMDNPIDGRGAPSRGEIATPTWHGLLPALLLLSSEAEDDEARATANRELERMARAADFASAFHLALKLAVPELREDLEGHIAGTTGLAFRWRAEDPLPSSFDEPENEKVAQRKKEALDCVTRVLAAAEGC